MGHLAFGQSPESQLAQHTKVPPLNDHFYLALLYGMMPSLLPYSMRLGNHVPLKWFQKLVHSREQLRQQTIDTVWQSIQLRDISHDRTLLDYVIDAHDPSSEEKLSEADVCTEAFGFL